MLCKLMLPEIRELIESRDGQTLSEVLDLWQPADIAELFEDLGDDDERAAFHLLHGPQRTLIFEYLDRPTQHLLLESLETADAGALLNDMSADDRTALLEELDDADREKHLRTLSAQQQAIARSLLEYPEDSVGRLMSPAFIAVRSNWTVEHVLDHVRRHGEDSETLNVVYVVDHDMHLIDDLRIRQILLAPIHTTLERLMDRNFIRLLATDSKRSAIEVFRRYDRSALPVVDDDNKLVGIVTIDDVLDVAEQAATEDAQKFGGLEALTEPYATTPLLTMVRKRATWLVILFLGELLTATAMGYFEHEINKAVVLALFIPLIISSGGNSGSQAATLIVRALAVGEIRLMDWLQRLSARIDFGTDSGCDSRFDRICPHRNLERILRDLRPALADGRNRGQPVACGHRSLGITHRFHASVWSQAVGARSCHIVGPVCCDVCGRDRTCHLFQCFDDGTADHTAERMISCQSG